MEIHRLSPCDISVFVSLTHLSVKVSQSVKHGACFSLFTQAEIAAQKKKGLTPIRKVGSKKKFSFCRKHGLDKKKVIFVLIFQPEVTLFGPHDTSRVSETELPPFSTEGKFGTPACCAICL